MQRERQPGPVVQAAQQHPVHPHEQAGAEQGEEVRPERLQPFAQAVARRSAQPGRDHQECAGHRQVERVENRHVGERIGIAVAVEVGMEGPQGKKHG